MMADFDAIVVGSGAGGLSAALRMAQQDVSVLVLEAMPSFGISRLTESFSVRRSCGNDGHKLQE